MRRHGTALRRLVTVSAVLLGVGLVLSGCSTSKFGAAAIAGNDRLTLATLDTDATNLSQAAKPYSNLFQLSATQATQDTITWWIRFQINEQLAQQAGITISSGDWQSALAEIYAEAKANAASQGVNNASLDLILANAGIPPKLSYLVGEYQAIDTRYETIVNGGKLPTTDSAVTAAGKKLQRAQCLAAKSLNIQVNPQFGRLDYSTYAVVTASSAVTRAEGPAKKASLSGLAPAC